MKKITLIILCLLVSTAIQAQCKSLEKFKEDFALQTEAFIIHQSDKGEIETMKLPDYYTLDLMKMHVKNMVDSDENITITNTWRLESRSGTVVARIDVNGCKTIMAFEVKNNAVIFLDAKENRDD